MMAKRGINFAAAVLKKLPALSSPLPVLLLVLLVATTGCDNTTPIKLGLVGGMTGRHSDLSNAAFSKAWYDFIKIWCEEKGLGVVVPVPFTSGPGIRFSDLAERISRDAPEGIVLATAALDAAMLCQQLRKKGLTVPVFSTMWAMSDDFIQHGGSAAEGVVFSHWFYREYQSDPARRFRSAFTERFGTEPNFASHFAYEAAQVLFKALLIDDNPARLKETIIKQEKFDGIQGGSLIDRFGDPERKVFLMTVRDGRFQALE